MEMWQSELKSEVDNLAKLFSNQSSCFRVKTQSFDELCFTFVASDEKTYDFKVIVTVSSRSLSIFTVLIEITSGQISIDDSCLVNSRS